MTRIASMSALTNEKTGYECKFPWPENCKVQAGGNGIVFRGKPGLEERMAKDPGDVLDQAIGEKPLAPQAYRTAFFEAFPRNPNTFIRGEGPSVEEAEEKAWQQLQKYQACEGHEFEKRGYKNGAGLCVHCNMFQSGVFEPTEDCTGGCGEKTYYSHDKNGNAWCENCYDSMPEEVMTDLQKMIRDMDPAE